MSKVTLHSPQGDRFLTSLPGETFHTLFLRTGVPHTAPCGGNGQCGNCKITVSGDVLPPDRKEAERLSDEELLSGVRLACMAMPTGDCTVTLTAGTAEWELTPSQEAVILPGGHGIACGIDIGTTTVVVYLYSKVTGQRLGVRSELNRQAGFGDDVIRRIDACRLPGGAEQQRRLITDQIREMTTALCRDIAIDLKDITACAVAGNTTMLHLLTGLDPAPLAVAPFTPQSLFGTVYRSEQLEFPFTCDVFLCPCVSAYVGGDIIAGIPVCELPPDAVGLLLDIGTNGEMVLMHGEDRFCLSVAAGPAFEGARIRNGVGGIPGAICHVTAEGYTTIGDLPATGLCGSGLLDTASLLLQKGVIDETGYMENAYPLTEDRRICLYPQDVRELQLAKAAVSAGIYRLTELAGLTVDHIDRVFLAGGFGTHLSPAAAAAVGLIPQKLQAKCQSAGNTAGMGAVRAALDDTLPDRLCQIAATCHYFELSGDAVFSRLYMEQMSF